MSKQTGVILVLFVALAIAAFWFLGISPNADRAEYAPEGHFVTMNAANSGPEEASDLYESIQNDMQERYARSDDPTAGVYQDWQQFNSAPYRSATHGQRFVNNYGNELAADYRSVKKGKPMPVGAILAKDAFAITKDGDVYAQSLFLMEKLPKGSSKVTGDWRYVMITPAGETYGDTNGQNPEKVDFCHQCHKSVQNSDYLFYVPKAYRNLQ
jgi:hypothetical protein